MKRIFYIFLVIILFFSLGTCSDTENAEQQKNIAETLTSEWKKGSEPLAFTNELPTTADKEYVTEIVYTTKTGKKYHSSKSCPGLSRAKAIYKSTLSNAIGQELGACKKCY